ncbi:MAG: MFS transporter [Gemmataceae bacterium]
MTHDLERTTLHAVAWRIVPFVCVLYVLNILDRANVGFARLAMQGDLGLSKAAFDLGYGMFYIGYLLFEVPSNLLLKRIGARIWIARIMITWGVVSAATMFAHDVWTFYALRILLGVAEAGFFPGIIYHLSKWFPDRERAKMTAFFMLAIGVSNVLGNPISGWIMDRFHGVSGLHGWQWLFLLEGLPTVIVGVLVLFVLMDTPRDAHWLSDEQRKWLIQRMAEEDLVRQQQHGPDKWQAMLQPRVWLLIVIYISVAVGSNASGAYFPTLVNEQFQGPYQLTENVFEKLREEHVPEDIITALTPLANRESPNRKSFAELLKETLPQDQLNGYRELILKHAIHPRLTNFQIGLLTALPHLCAILAMSLVGISSDRSGERRWHLAGSALAAALGWCLVAWEPSPLVAMIGLCIAQAGMMSMLPVFWTLPTAFLSGTAAAGGIALINSVANIGGFFGATILGQLGLWSMAGILFAGSILTAGTIRGSFLPQREKVKNRYE